MNLLGGFSSSSLEALAIGLAGKINEQIGEGKEISNVDRDGESLTGSIQAVWNKQVADSERHADQELGDLN